MKTVLKVVLLTVAAIPILFVVAIAAVYAGLYIGVYSLIWEDQLWPDKQINQETPYVQQEEIQKSY